MGRLPRSAGLIEVTTLFCLLCLLVKVAAQPYWLEINYEDGDDFSIHYDSAKPSESKIYWHDITFNADGFQTVHCRYGGGNRLELPNAQGDRIPLNPETNENRDPREHPVQITMTIELNVNSTGEKPTQEMNIPIVWRGNGADGEKVGSISLKSITVTKESSTKSFVVCKLPSGALVPEHAALFKIITVPSFEGSGRAEKFRATKSTFEHISGHTPMFVFTLNHPWQKSERQAHGGYKHVQYAVAIPKSAGSSIETQEELIKRINLKEVSSQEVLGDFHILRANQIGLADATKRELVVSLKYDSILKISYRNNKVIRTVALFFEADGYRSRRYNYNGGTSLCYGGYHRPICEEVKEFVLEQENALSVQDQEVVRRPNKVDMHIELNIGSHAERRFHIESYAVEWNDANADEWKVAARGHITLKPLVASEESGNCMLVACLLPNSNIQIKRAAVFEVIDDASGAKSIHRQTESFVDLSDRSPPQLHFHIKDGWHAGRVVFVLIPKAQNSQLVFAHYEGYPYSGETLEDLRRHFHVLQAAGDGTGLVDGRSEIEISGEQKAQMPLSKVVVEHDNDEKLDEC